MSVDPDAARAMPARRSARELAAPDLAGVVILSDGLNVNGSALVEGVVSAIGANVPVSGGLAGDGAHFAETLVGCNGAPRAARVAAVGTLRRAIRFGHGSAGGWDVFGPKRKISKSAGNVLLEVDGKPALDLYKLYLGPEESQKLPGSALLFPMRISDPRHPERSVVRTVLAVDLEAGSMIFAGDMPEGWTAQLMRGSFSRLCAGAAEATHKAVGGTRREQRRQRRDPRLLHRPAPADGAADRRRDRGGDRRAAGELPAGGLLLLLARSRRTSAPARCRCTTRP